MQCKSASFQLNIEPGHRDGHGLQRTEGVLDGQFEHVIAFLLHLQITVVRIISICKHKILGRVQALILPFLQIRNFRLDFLLNIAKVDAAELIVHGELVLRVGGRRKQSGKLALLLLAFQLVVADYQIDQG